MKPETKLKKIMALPDSNVKVAKLYSFCFSVLCGCPLHNMAYDEIIRLSEIGFSMAKLVENINNK